MQKACLQIFITNSKSCLLRIGCKFPVPAGVRLGLRSSSAAMGTQQGLPMEVVDRWMKEFPEDKARVVAQKACTKFDTVSFLADRSQTQTHFFNTKVTPEVKPVCDQKSSGRCWIYANMNILRIHFCRKYNLEEFEFSQSYIFFWDKVERCNYMLGAFISLIEKGSGYDERTLNHLLRDPTSDGGQWQMLVNLIEKYGVLPNVHWKSPYLANNSRRLGAILNAQLRAHCHTLMSMHESGASNSELQAARLTMMNSLFNVISTCLGSPPSTFDLEFYDKDKNYSKFGPMTPLQFYKDMVKPLCNLEDLVCITNDPRPSNVYNKLYTVEYLNNMDNAGNVVYINLPIEQLKKYARISLQNNEPVWFGCDVGKEMYRTEGILSADQFDYEMVLGIPSRAMDKAARLQYKESEMTHAMVFTACNVEEKDGEKKVTKWRVENSWGETKDDGKGYMVMADNWFSEHMYLVVVNKRHLPEEILSILGDEPIMLPAWDPMGALAQ